MGADLISSISGLPTEIYLGENVTEAARQANRSIAAAEEAKEYLNAIDSLYISLQGDGKIYASIETGLEQTNDGDYFTVAGNGIETYVILYKNASGEAELVSSFPSVEAFQNFQDLLSSTLGASMIGVSQTGAGASPQTLEEAYREKVKVTQFMGYLSARAAFQAAVDRLNDGDELEVPKGIYSFDEPVLCKDKTNIRIVGFAAQIKALNRFSEFLKFENCTNVIVDGLTFDQGQDILPEFTAGDYAGGPLNVPVSIEGSQAVLVQNCKFNNLYTTAVLAYQSSGVVVYRCDFTSPVQTQYQWIQHVHFQTCSGLNAVEMCTFINEAPSSAAYAPAGVYASGITGALHIVRNFFNHCGRDNTGSHRVGCIDIYGDASHVYVQDNIAINCWGVWGRINAVRNSKILNNHIHRNGGAETLGNILEITGSTIFGGQKGTDTSLVEGNLLYNTDGKAAAVILIASYDWGAPTKDVRINKNKFFGAIQSINIQGPFDGIKITDNRMRFGRGVIVVLPGTGISSDLGDEADSCYRGLTIQDNDYEDVSGDDANAVVIDINTSTSAYIGDFKIDRNTFTSTVPSAAPAISVRLKSANPEETRLFIRDNDISGYATGVVAQEMGEATVTDNRMDGTTTTISATNVGVLHRGGNKISSDPSRGEATLVNGIFTVESKEVRSDSFIRIFMKEPIGTPGILYPENIVDNTSFDVASTSSTADQSKFTWEVDN